MSPQLPTIRIPTPEELSKDYEDKLDKDGRILFGMDILKALGIPRPSSETNDLDIQKDPDVPHLFFWLWGDSGYRFLYKYNVFSDTWKFALERWSADVEGWMPCGTYEHELDLTSFVVKAMRQK